MSHIQFTRDFRVELAALRRAGKNQSECGRALGMHRSSVCRELELNTDADGVYRGPSAHRKHVARKKKAKQYQRKIRGTLRAKVLRQLKHFWSPEQIAGREKKKGGLLCHETVYQFVYQKRPDLVVCLRRQKSKYRKKRGSRARKAFAKALKVRRIEERPAIVETRERVGDWDRDTEKDTGMGVYRATPYHSWERGTNENWNGLLRQFFPKGMVFATITQSDVDRAVRLLNDRPRKRLGYATPREVFRACCNSY